jgi:hypothetical protein
MVIELKTSSRKIISILLLACFTLVSAWFMAVPWAASFSIPEIPNDPDLLRSWWYHPANPQFRHQHLGRIHQYSLTHQDYREALNQYRSALLSNPLSSRTWFDVAKVHWWMGRVDEAKQALILALRFDPSGAKLRWESAVFLIQLGSYDEAVDNLKHLVKTDRSKRSSYFALLGTLTTPTDLIETIIPPDREVLSDYLDFTIAHGDPGSARAVWKRLDQVPGGPLDSDLILSYIELMISQKMIGEAGAAWVAVSNRKRPQGQGPSDNLIWNGGLEREETLGRGFDWRIRSIPGVEVGFDASNQKEGKRSLKISFDGTKNVDFSGVWQVVRIKPNTRYTLGAFIRTNGLTTSNGLRLEALDFLDGRPYGVTEELVGNHEWSQVKTSFLTSSLAQAVVVRVRREASQKLDNLIAGTAWIDQLILREIP